MIIEEEGKSKENNQNNSKQSVKKFAEDTNEKIKKKKMILYLKQLNL